MIKRCLFIFVFSRILIFIFLGFWFIYIGFFLSVGIGLIGINIMLIEFFSVFSGIVVRKVFKFIRICFFIYIGVGEIVIFYIVGVVLKFCKKVKDYFNIIKF